MKRYSGRDFTDPEIEMIRQFIINHFSASRRRLSVLVCEKLNWRKPNGTVKDMSCRVALLRMQDDGLITLQPAKPCTLNQRPLVILHTVETEPGTIIQKPVHELDPIELQLVVNQKHSRLWNEYIDRYHYLGYKKLPGAQLRYIVISGFHIIALLGFGASAWKTAPRDKFIGWTDEQRKQNLQLIVNNARFLILPWIQSKNLASKILAKAAKQLPQDWLKRYQYAPVLLETFVEIPRFTGGCYKAANWIYVGTTKGRGKLDRYKEAKLPKKDIWLFPLHKRFVTIQHNFQKNT